jgi:hypothetical protein
MRVVIKNGKPPKTRHKIEEPWSSTRAGQTFFLAFPKGDYTVRRRFVNGTHKKAARRWGVGNYEARTLEETISNGNGKKRKVEGIRVWRIR